MRKESQYKARKGLIKVSLDEDKQVIKEIVISGDFFLYPEDKLWVLEKKLIGTRLSKEDLLTTVRGFYHQFGVLSPGLEPEDFVEAIMRAA